MNSWLATAPEAWRSQTHGRSLDFVVAVGKRRAMPRERLPNRRPSLTATAAWPLNGANAVHVSISIDLAGRVREVFARAARPDSELDLVADDAGVLLSLLLQNGATLAAIVHSMGRSSEGAPASVIALVADVALRIEAELQGPRLVDETGGAAP